MSLDTMKEKAVPLEMQLQSFTWRDVVRVPATCHHGDGMYSQSPGSITLDKNAENIFSYVRGRSNWKRGVPLPGRGKPN